MKRNSKMMPLLTECFECFLKNSRNNSRLLGLNKEEQNRTTFKTMEKILEKCVDLEVEDLPCSAFLGPYCCFNSIVEVTKNLDPFRELNQETNEKILHSCYDELKKLVSIENENEKEKKLFRALILATMGNSFDFASLSEEEIYNIFNSKIADTKELEKMEFTLLKDYQIFLDKLENAKSLLVIGDNNGEIVFDKVLIEFLKDYYSIESVYYAVRGKPVMNDVTEEDAVFVGLDKICSGILKSSNTSYQGCIIEEGEAPLEFIERYNNVDIILSKGMGNFESLCFEDEKDNLFFLFMVKCIALEQFLGIPIESLVFTSPLTKDEVTII